MNTPIAAAVSTTSVMIIAQTGIGFFVLFVNFSFPLSENETFLRRPAYKEKQHFYKYFADIFVVYEIFHT
jgi:hypothetical protein